MGLEDELQQFTGTERYYRNFTGLLYTDGIQYLADKANSYWLIDLVGSYQYKYKNVPFQFWELNKNQDKSADITMKEDADQPNIIKQHIPYTDFPLNYFSFYCINNVMLLKTEY